MKENKGKTLVALIITIIVLLILAVVTISAVNEGSLFAHANNAATAYSEAQKEENTMISNWLTEIEKHIGGYKLDETVVYGYYIEEDGHWVRYYCRFEKNGENKVDVYSVGKDSSDENNYKYCETFDFIDGKAYTSDMDEPVIVFGTNKIQIYSDGNYLDVPVLSMTVSEFNELYENAEEGH